MAICHWRVRIRKRTLEEPSSSAEEIASNDDLLIELLLRLPIRSLLKFKCVCKRWRSLIADSHFSRRKWLMSNAVSAVYLDCRSYVGGEGRYELVPLDPSETWVSLEYFKFADNPRLIGIRHSCNGLLLFSSFGGNKYLVYNPTTKQSKTLPPLPPLPHPTFLPLPPVRARAKMEEWGVFLAFDPSKSPFYKVVCILGSEDYYDVHFQILIYSSETGLWRVSGSPFTAPDLEPQFWYGVYCNDAIHWNSETNASLYFDMTEEVVQEMPMPPPLEYDEQLRRYFGESGEHLYLVDCYLDLTTHLNVYEMERDRSGWLLKFRVDQDGLTRFRTRHIYPIFVVYVARGEKEEDSFMVLYMSDDKVVKYNFITQTHQELCKMDFETVAMPPSYPYIESLSLV